MIPAGSVEEMLDRVREVLMCLRKAGLTASLEKSQFLYTETDFLGHGVSDRGLLTQERKVDAITNYPPPCNRKKLEVLGNGGVVCQIYPRLCHCV